MYWKNDRITVNGLDALRCLSCLAEDCLLGYSSLLGLNPLSERGCGLSDRVHSAN